MKEATSTYHLVNSMFQCRACVWRSIRAIAGENHKPHQILAGRALILTPHIRPIRRHASTAISPKEPEELEEELVQGKQPEDLDDGGQRTSSSAASERHLKLELKYLQDKVKLAEHVHYTLRCDKPEKALDLCRLASRQQDAVVSWNHVVNWYMQKGKVDDALKIYNEMKKRAQFPDSYTYSLILRGLAKSEDPTAPVKASNVTKALSVYHSMSSPTSRVKPGIIHTNNVMKVCREALDMDALWGIVAKLPETGAGAPDEYTYAILLDAIRYGTFGMDPTNVPLEDIEKARAKAMHEARAVWSDVMKRWRNGQMYIDERLIVAMGAVLRMSAKIRDWDDVLNLVHQTTNIPRQLPALGSPGRHIEHIPLQENDLRAIEPEVQVDEDGYSDTPTATAFMPLTGNVATSNRKGSLLFVKPTRSILGLLVETCTLLRSPKAARAYWDLLTDPKGPYAVQPEIGTYHTYLRLHAKNRASAQCVALLRQMAEAKVQPSAGTFRIAMAVLERDIKNVHYLTNARAVIDVMESTLADPDVPTLVKYLNLMLATDNSKEIIFTINRLDSIVQNLRSRVTYGSDKTGRSPKEHMLEIDETLQFFRSFIGVMDVILHRELIPKEEYSQWINRRKTLTAFVESSRRKLLLQKTRYESQTGEVVPMNKGMYFDSGRQRSDSYELTQFRYKRRLAHMQETESDETARVKGLYHWDVRDARPDIQTRGERMASWTRERGWKSGDKGEEVDGKTLRERTWKLRDQGKEKRIELNDGAMKEVEAKQGRAHGGTRKQNDARTRRGKKLEDGQNQRSGVEMKHVRVSAHTPMGSSDK